MVFQPQSRDSKPAEVAGVHLCCQHRCNLSSVLIFLCLPPFVCLFLLCLQSQPELCILLPSGFPHSFRDELQATTIQARFLQAGWARRIPTGKWPQVFSTAQATELRIFAEDPTVPLHT